MPPMNPFSGSNPFANEDWTGLGLSRKQRPAFTPLPEPEAEATKDSLVNKGLSGLSWLGSTLDKAFGARALRGLAVGDKREALSAIPFSDSLGITKPEDSHSMDEVLQHHNLVRPNDPDRWELRDFAVPALSIAADPGTYINPLGATTKLGQVAAKAGALPRGLKAGMQGFEATVPGLKALGHTDEMIAHATRAGQRIAPESVVNAARAAGIDDVVGQPLKGAFGLSLPFRQPSAAIGTGKIAQGWGGLLDSAATGIKFAPGVRHVRGLLDPDAGRSFNATAQQASEFGARPVTRAMQAATDSLEHQSRFGLEPLLGGPGVPQGFEREATRLIRQRAEKIHQAGDQGLWEQAFRQRHADGLTTNVADPNAVADYVKTHWDRLARMGDDFAGQNKAWLEEARRMGGRGVSSATANQDYLARQYIGVPNQAGGAGVSGAKFLNPRTASDIARKKFLRDIPGGTEQINDWVINPALSGAGRTLSRADVKAKVLNDMVTQIQQSGRLLNYTPERVADLQKVAGLQASWLGKLNPIHAQGKVPFFDPDPIAAMAMRGKRQAQSIGNLAGLYEGAARAARPIGAFGSPDEFVRLDRFLDSTGAKSRLVPAKLLPAEEAELMRSGLTADQALAAHASAGPGGSPISGALAAALTRKAHEGAAVRMYEQLARHGAPLQDFSTGVADPFATLMKYGVPKQEAGALQQFMAGWSPKPHELSPLVRRLDSANNLFKNMVYPLWPAAHLRNLTSAVYNNAIHGTPIRSYLDAAKVIGRKGIDDATAYAHLSPHWAAMTPEARSDLLHELAFAHAKVFQGAGGATELVGRHGLEPIAEKIAARERIVPHVPGDSAHLLGPRGVLAQARQRGLASLDPRGQAGVFGRTEDTFAPLVAGRRLGTNIEDQVRMASFLGELRKGATPEVAGALANRVHFDYSDLTRFEKEGMRRVFPFYTFMRKNLPAQVRMLGSQPGNLSAPIKALTHVDQNREGYTPDYLSSGVAIPMGQAVNPADGRMHTRYLNKVGLPFEEAFERFRFTHNLPNPVATLRSFLGSANPYVKAPLEMATDTQLHTGRRLSDLRSEGVFGGLGYLPPEVAQPLTQILANSPLARFGTTTDKLIDPRKGPGIKALNLLTGVGITDVDAAKLREVEARREAEALLKQDPNVKQFTNLYVQPGQAGTVSPQTERLMRLYTGMKDDAKKYAEEKAARERAAKLRSIVGPGIF